MPADSTTKKKTTAAPADDKYSVSSWGASQTGGVSDLEVPSGQLCLVKRPGVEGLLREGVLRDLDTFTALVDTEHVQRVKGKKAGKKAEKQQQEAISEMLKDPSKMANVMHTIDRVICHVVLKPDVQMTPNDPTRREKGVVYADMIDMNDKMFIFNFVVGGSRDIERFLEESRAAVGDVDSGEDVEGEAE